jgi:hypothetical protein
MDLAPNSTKSMECLKGYSAKPCFVLTRGVGWKLPTFATHYTTYRFVYFPLPDAPFPSRLPRAASSAPPPGMVLPNTKAGTAASPASPPEIDLVFPVQRS